MAARIFEFFNLSESPCHQREMYAIVVVFNRLQELLGDVVNNQREEAGTFIVNIFFFFFHETKSLVVVANPCSLTPKLWISKKILAA